MKQWRIYNSQLDFEFSMSLLCVLENFHYYRMLYHLCSTKKLHSCSFTLHSLALYLFVPDQLLQNMGIKFIYIIHFTSCEEYLESSFSRFWVCICMCVCVFCQCNLLGKCRKLPSSQCLQYVESGLRNSWGKWDEKKFQQNILILWWDR